MPDITSANAVLLLSVPLLLPVAQQIQGWGVDDAFDVEDVSPTEIMMGLDGQLSAGFVFVARPMTITLMAGSPSNDFFDSWVSSQQAGTQVFPADGQLTMTSIQKAYTLTTGFLTRFHPLADAKRVLQARKYVITWNNIAPVPIGVAG